MVVGWKGENGDIKVGGVFVGFWFFKFLDLCLMEEFIWVNVSELLPYGFVAYEEEVGGASGGFYSEVVPLSFPFLFCEQVAGAPVFGEGDNVRTVISAMQSEEGGANVDHIIGVAPDVDTCILANSPEDSFVDQGFSQKDRFPSLRGVFFVRDFPNQETGEPGLGEFPKHDASFFCDGEVTGFHLLFVFEVIIVEVFRDGVSSSQEGCADTAVKGLGFQGNACDLANAFQCGSSVFQDTCGVKPEKGVLVAVQAGLDGGAHFGADVPGVEEHIQFCFWEMGAMGKVCEEVKADAHTCSEDRFAGILHEFFEGSGVVEVGKASFVYEDGDLGVRGRDSEGFGEGLEDTLSPLPDSLGIEPAIAP